jgi:hypothetical protein
MLNIAFAIQILLSIALGLLANVTIISFSTLKLKLIIGLVIRSVFKVRCNYLNYKEAYIIKLYIYNLANILIY